MTDDPGKRVAAQGLHRRLHPTTLPQLHARLGVIEDCLTGVDARLGGGLPALYLDAIEVRLTAIETHPAGIEGRIPYGGGGPVLLMSVYSVR